MRNKYIKFMDKHRLSHSVARELLGKGLLTQSLVSLKEEHLRIAEQVHAVGKLIEMVEKDIAAGITLEEIFPIYVVTPGPKITPPERVTATQMKKLLRKSKPLDEVEEYGI